MKNPEIRRGIQSRHMRMTGDAPKIGKVARFREGDTNAGGRRRRRRVGTGGGKSMTAARRRVILTWSAVLGLLTLLVLGGFMGLWLGAHVGKKAVSSDKVSAKTETQVRVVSKFPSPSENEALSLVKQAVTNRDPEKVKTYFHPGGANPAEVVTYFADSETRGDRILSYKWLSSMDKDGMLMEGVLVVYSGEKRPDERLAFLMPDEQGVWKVDFDAFARTIRPSWKDFMERKADHAQVRVFVGKDTYYNGPFKDEGQWVCYGMRFPESEELLRGYCRVGSRQAHALEGIFSGRSILSEGTPMSRAILEIKWKEGAESRQFEITRVFAEDWVLPPTPLDERL